MLWLAAIAAGLLAVLAVPVDVAFTVRRREERETRLESAFTVGWLWGLIRLRVPEGRRQKAGRAKPKSKRRRPGLPSGTHHALAMARSRGFPRRVLRFMRDVLRRTHLRRLELDLRIGLDDPADTGRLWGLIGPATVFLPLPSAARVAVTPAFTGPLLYLDARAEARIVPAALLAPMLAFLLSPPTLRAAYAAARGRS